MGEFMKKVSMSDIAKAANVSKGTVSNALNGKNHMLSQEKKEEILRIAEEMGYQKINHLIRFVVFERQSRAGKMKMDETEAFRELYSAIEEECERNHYKVALNHIHESEKTRGFEYIETLADSDGLIILGWELQQDDLRWLRNITDLPFVVVDASFSDPDFDFITSNNTDAANQLTQKMIDMGHKRIAYIDGGNMSVNKERFTGYQNALIENHIGFDPTLICYIDRQEKSIFTDEIREFLQRQAKRTSPMPSAVLCCDDRVAVSLMAVAVSMKLKLATAGFDNLPLCLEQIPQLSSVAVNASYTGTVTARRMIEKIETKDLRTQKIYVESDVFFRDSIFKLNKSHNV